MTFQLFSFPKAMRRFLLGMRGCFPTLCQGSSLPTSVRGSSSLIWSLLKDSERGGFWAIKHQPRSQYLCGHLYVLCKLELWADTGSLTVDTGREEQQGDNGVIGSIGWRDPRSPPLCLHPFLPYEFQFLLDPWPQWGIHSHKSGQTGWNEKEKKKKKRR